MEHPKIVLVFFIILHAKFLDIFNERQLKIRITARKNLMNSVN